MAKMQENTDADLGRSSEEIINECMIISALDSTALALESGLREDQIIISCKVSRPRDLIAVYRALASRTTQPLHLGLTEAGMGIKGLVWSASAMGVLLNDGIGDTIRVSLTPRPNGDRRDEVHAACELLQALGLRSFAPSITACPGCGRTTSSTFQELAERNPGICPQHDAAVEDALRRRRGHERRRHGMRRERSRRIEGGQHRHQPAGHRRGPHLPGVHRRTACPYAARFRTTSSRRSSVRSWTSTSTGRTRGSPHLRAPPDLAVRADPPDRHRHRRHPARQPRRVAGAQPAGRAAGGRCRGPRRAGDRPRLPPRRSDNRRAGPRHRPDRQQWRTDQDGRRRDPGLPPAAAPHGARGAGRAQAAAPGASP